jgi:S1-C subfamily serine protease
MPTANLLSAAKENNVEYLSASKAIDSSDSFVKIEFGTWVTFNCLPEEIAMGCVEESKKIDTIIGSGSVIKKSFMGTYILTAAHVCDPYSFGLGKKIDHIGHLNYYSEITAKSFYGISGNFEIKKIDTENDICVIHSKKIWPLTPALKMAKTPPLRGDRIYILGAPRGVFWPGVALFFEGYYMGVDPENWAVYTAPVVPGTSGGPVLNENGKMVGIIHSGLRDMENVGFGTSWDFTRHFLKDI